MNNISSPQNPAIKRLLRLRDKSAERRREGVFVVEGRREVEHCQEAGYEIETLFVCPLGVEQAVPACYKCSRPYRPAPGAPELPPATPPADTAGDTYSRLVEPALRPTLIQVTPRVYERIALRGSTEGVVAIIRERRLTLAQLHLPTDALVVVVESVEKPGNLGAILRTADAAGVHAVIVCDPLTDLYNPNLLRASLGAAFTVPLVATTTAECIAFLKEKRITILTAQLQDSHLYYDTDMRRATAIVLGTEATGLTPVWREAADAHIRIPMLGRLDSLNVSVSAAILVYEAVRQRNEDK